MSEPLFDAQGRRIPYSGMRVHNQVSRQYFRLLQPDVDYAAIHARTVKHLNVSDPPVSSERFAKACMGILDSLRADATLAGLVCGVHVPFLCPRSSPELGRSEDLLPFLEGVNAAYVERFPDFDFMNLCSGKPDGRATLAQGSRYEQFESARKRGPVAGIYFPNCLAEYDVASQRRQMETLPSQAGSVAIVLSGAVDAAAALIGSPDLLWNEDNYPHHLCLSALEEPGDNIVYTFEAYGHNLRFRYRSIFLTPEVSQLSEQWAGGLTIFVGLT
jgi:hypothetical protein